MKEVWQMDKKLIYVGGISGVGKSSVIHGASVKTGLPHIRTGQTLGCILRVDDYGDISVELSRMNLRERKRVNKQMWESIFNQYDQGMIDGHYACRHSPTRDGYFNYFNPFPSNMVLYISQLVMIDDRIDNIQHNRAKDLGVRCRDVDIHQVKYDYYAENKGLRRVRKIKMIPTLIIFKNGNLQYGVDELVKVCGEVYGHSNLRD